MLCTEIVLLLYSLLCVGFRMLHKFVVNLCVTPHVHASWRGVCWDKAFRHLRRSIVMLCWPCFYLCPLHLFCRSALR